MRQTQIIFILLLSILTLSKAQKSNISSGDNKQFYFPVEAFRDTSTNGNNDFLNTWFSKHLFAMNEPVIHLDNSQNEIYRFTWLRTFHNPITIRVEKKGEEYFLFWKVCNGAGGYAPGVLIINRQKTIDKLTWDKFRAMIDKATFWNMATIDSDIGGTDGAQWILEGKNQNKYHVTERWSPNKKSEYYKCCDFLISLTDLNIKGNDKY